jgi:hypothetical protein
VILPAIYRAVASIHDDSGTLVGTGFLASDDGLVLTARHVVDRLRVCGARFSVREGIIAGEVCCRGTARDWALIRLAAMPSDVRAIPLVQLPARTGTVKWSTAGHARLRGHESGPFHGEIVADTERELDLFCEELRDKSYDDARGLSGGPCIVDGAAVGVVTDVLHAHGPIVGGQVMATPIAGIVAEAAAAGIAGMTVVNVGAPLPWQENFTAPLESLAPTMSRKAARAAGILAEPSPWLAEQVARRMSHGGLGTVVEVLRALGASVTRDQRYEVLGLGETLWIDEMAADALLDHLQRDAPAVLAVTKQRAAEQHLHRASGRADGAPIPWRSVYVGPVHDEPFAERVLARIVEELCAPGEPTIEDARGFSNDLRPVTAFVESQPRQDVVDKVRCELPGLRLVFASRLDANRPLVTIGVVRPVASPAAESLALEARTRARSMFREQEGRR